MKLPLLALLCYVALTVDAVAQYPTKPVRIINPFAEGGGGGISTRIVAQKISENTGKTFVVESRVGAGGRVGYGAVAKSPGDGYTLVASDTTYTMMPALYGGFPWGNDHELVPVTILAATPFVVVVSPKLGISTVKELIALAKSRPAKLNYGSAGIGSVTHVVTEWFKREAEIDITHIPYKGSGDAITGLLTGSVDVLIMSTLSYLPFVDSGKMVPVAVASAKRLRALPHVPSAVEAGLPKFIAGNWFGWSAPKGTPREAIDWLHAEAAKALASPELQERFAQQGSETSGVTPDEFAVIVQNDIRRWSDVIKAARISTD